MTADDRARLDANRKAGLAARKTAKLARLRHRVARRWCDARGHHAVCACGWRTTAPTSVERDQAIAKHLLDNSPLNPTGTTRRTRR